MSTEQSPIFLLLRVYNFTTAHLPIIYLLQIDQLLHHWKSSKYLITVHTKMALQLQIVYFEIFRRFIRLLCKAKFFWSCAPYYYFSSPHLSIICLPQIDQLFHHSKSSKYLVTVHWKVVWPLQIANLEIFRRLMSTAKDQFFGFCATIILLLRISMLFVYCKSTNYFTNGNRLNICLLCIDKLYDTFKSPIRKYFDDLYGFCGKPNFSATAHLSFCYCASPYYLCIANRQIISRLEMV